MKNEFVYIFVVMIISCLYCLGYFQRWNYGILSYTAYAVMFIILLILITMKIRIKSRLLDWFGDHVFSVYILQRIPMIVLDYLGVLENHKYLYLVLCIVFTMILAVMFENIRFLKGKKRNHGRKY